MAVRATTLLAASAMLAITLAACKPDTGSRANDATMVALPDLPATLPLEPGAATPIAYAPAADALPAAPQVRTVRVAESGADYAYADQADWFEDALYDSPPDYAFDYDGVDPWAWQGYDQSLAFAEPVDDGYRYYFYRPGEDYPYLVRDRDYAYGYDDGALAVVYDSFGAVVPYAAYGARRDYAGRYLLRGRELYRASRGRDRRAVIAGNWAARQRLIYAARSNWRDARVRQADWRDYRTRIAPRQARYWQQETVRRRDDSQRYANWQREAFRTPPPPRAIPATWQSARWAKDDRRYAVARPERALRIAQQQRAERRDLRGPGPDVANIPGRPPLRVLNAGPDDARQRAEGQVRAQQQAQRQAERQQRAQQQGQRQAAERQSAQRQQADQGRAQQQTQRQAERQQRAQQQGQRRAAEQQRAQRQQAGQGRAQQQAQRQAERQQRAQQQGQRRAAEQQRAQRQQADQARAQQQAQRQAERQQRAQQQGQRQAAEQQRAQRQQADQARAQRESQRQAAQQQRAQQQQAAGQARAQQQAQRQAAQQARAQQQPARAAQPAQQPRGDRPGRGPGGGHGNR